MPADDDVKGIGSEEWESRLNSVGVQCGELLSQPFDS